MSKMEVKTSLLDNMIGVGDMVLLEPLSEESFIDNLRKRFDHNEIYVSHTHPFSQSTKAPMDYQLLSNIFNFFCLLLRA